MPKTVRTIKDDNGNDLDIYVDNCNVCNREMAFPKAEADKIHMMFPFLKQRADAGSPCVECALKQEKEENKMLFSPEEIQKIKTAIMNGNG